MKVILGNARRRALLRLVRERTRVIHGRYDICGGRGWYDDGHGELYCACDAGRRLRGKDRE